MKNVLAVFSCVILIAVMTGCSSHWGSAGLGAVGGAAVGVGSYEYNLKKQKDRIEEDYIGVTLTATRKSLLKDSSNERELLPRFLEIKKQSKMPIFIYLIQRL
jgi:hypothetical protein